MEAAASDYWWESHFLVPAIQHQQANLGQSQGSHQSHSQHPSASNHPPPITAQPAHRAAEFVNPVHIAWDSMYTLCTNNSDANLANHSAAIFAPFCNIRRALPPPHNQPAAPPLPTPPPHSPYNHEDSHATSPNPPSRS